MKGREEEAGSGRECGSERSRLAPRRAPEPRFPIRSVPVRVDQLGPWTSFLFYMWLGLPWEQEQSRCESWGGSRRNLWASPVAQWLRIRLPMQGTWVQFLVREDPTCRGATEPVRHNYWAYALEPTSHNYWARVPQLLKPTRLEPVLHNERSHCNEKPVHCNEE